MMGDETPTIQYAATDQLPADDRLLYWDSYNASALVGLRTSSLAPEGLRARQANAALRNMHIAEIEGNDHMIERNPRLVSAYPKESVFACHLLRGNAYFVQNGRQYVVPQNSTILYDTRRPFVYGFLSDMHQLLIDIPIADLSQAWGLTESDLPLCLSPDAKLDAALAAELRRTTLGYMRCPTTAGAQALPETAHSLLRAMIQAGTGGHDAVDRSILHLLAAKRYIAEHICDPNLSTSDVAANVGVSVRHLNRLFALEQTSLGDYIWSRRAAGARHDLLNAPQGRVSIGEIAYRWGFSSQAHFSRMIASRYGKTPSEIRKLSSAPT